MSRFVSAFSTALFVVGNARADHGAQVFSSCFVANALTWSVRLRTAARDSCLTFVVCTDAAVPIKVAADALEVASTHRVVDEDLNPVWSTTAAHKPFDHDVTVVHCQIPAETIHLQFVGSPPVHEPPKRVGQLVEHLLIRQIWPAQTKNDWSSGWHRDRENAVVVADSEWFSRSRSCGVCHIKSAVYWRSCTQTVKRSEEVASSRKATSKRLVFVWLARRAVAKADATTVHDRGFFAPLLAEAVCKQNDLARSVVARAIRLCQRWHANLSHREGVLFCADALDASIVKRLSNSAVDAINWILERGTECLCLLSLFFVALGLLLGVALLNRRAGLRDEQVFTGDLPVFCQAS